MQAIKAARPGGRWVTSACRMGCRWIVSSCSSRMSVCTAVPRRFAQYLPKLIDLVFNGTINPGKVFDLVLPLAQVAEGYRAMDERRAIKTLLQP